MKQINQLVNSDYKIYSVLHKEIDEINKQKHN